MKSVVFLHGFLGSCRDWDSVISFLSELDSSVVCYTLSLPGHSGIPSGDFDSSSQYIVNYVRSLNLDEPPLLVGYSLGGRLLMHSLLKYPDLADQVCLIAAHPGLLSEAEKRSRYYSDLVWVEKLKSDSYRSFLQEWYAQPLFYNFSLLSLFNDIFESRLALNNPQDLAEMLQQTSLAHQPDLWLVLERLGIRCSYLCGSSDTKFLEIAKEMDSNGWGCRIGIFEDVGHVVHLEAPEKVARFIAELIKD